MPRKKLIRQSEFPYHVTTRTSNRDWFPIPISEVWDVIKESLIYSLKSCNAKIHCFVLMGNHYHLIISTPDKNIDIFMRLFNSSISRFISKRSGLKQQRFAGPYKWTILDHKGYLLNVYRYIYQNPVRAKIVRNPFDYPYSSLHFSMFEAKLFNYSPHIVYGKEKSWLEKYYGEEFEQLMKSTLKKKSFSHIKGSSIHHQNILNKPTHHI